MEDIPSSQIRHDVEKIVDNVRAEKGGKRVGLILLPPQKDEAKDNRVKDINQILKSKCEDTEMGIVDCKFTIHDINANGQLNSRGKAKLSGSIIGYARMVTLATTNV